MNRQNYREISFQFLLDYARKTDEAKNTQYFSDLLSELEGHFHVLSRFVHMHSKHFIPYAGINVCAAHATTISFLKEKSLELWPLLIVVLITFFPAKYLKANANEKMLVRTATGTALWKKTAEYLRSLAVK